jgi:hypothetical protein
MKSSRDKVPWPLQKVVLSSSHPSSSRKGSTSIKKVQLCYGGFMPSPRGARSPRTNVLNNGPNHHQNRRTSSRIMEGECSNNPHGKNILSIMVDLGSFHQVNF